MEYMAKRNRDFRAGIRTWTGAYLCLGFISLDEYLAALGELDIEWQLV